MIDVVKGIGPSCEEKIRAHSHIRWCRLVECVVACSPLTKITLSVIMEGNDAHHLEAHETMPIDLANPLSDDTYF